MENQNELNELVNEQNELVRNLNNVNKADADVVGNRYDNDESKQSISHEFKMIQ